MATEVRAGGVKNPAVIKPQAEAGASKNTSAAIGVQRSIWRTVSHGNTAFIGFHATSRVCEYANSQWQKGGANILVAGLAYTVGQVVAFVFDIVKTAFTLLTLPLPLLPGFHVVLNAFQGTRSDLYGSYIDFSKMRNLNNANARGDDLASKMALLADAEQAYTAELSLSQMDQGDHSRMREADQVRREARKAIVNDILQDKNLKAGGVLKEIRAQAKHLEDLKNRPYPLRAFEGDTQERLTVSLSDRVLEKLEEEVYGGILDKASREIRYDLHAELQHAKWFNEQATELFGDLATIPGCTKEGSEESLAKLLVNNGKDFETAAKKLEQLCSTKKAWTDFVGTKTKVTEQDVKALQKHLSESPADLIGKLNAPIQCDIGAGTKHHAGKVVKTIEGLAIAKDAKFEDVQSKVDAKVEELKALISAFEEQNSAIGVMNIVNGWSDVEFSEQAIEENFKGFIEYQQAICQLWHLTKGTGYNTISAQMAEKTKELAAKEKELADVPGTCLDIIESRRKFIDRLSPVEIQWKHVENFNGFRENEQVEATNPDDSEVEEAPAGAGTDAADGSDTDATEEKQDITNTEETEEAPADDGDGEEPVAFN